MAQKLSVVFLLFLMTIYPYSVWPMNAEKACPGGFCAGLGESFYLPDTNAQGLNTAGRKILKNAPRLNQGCATALVPYKQANDSFSEASGMTSVVRNLATTSSISGDVKTLKLAMKASAELQTGESVDLNESFMNVTYDRSEIQGVVDLGNQDECIGQTAYNDDFMGAFRSLPHDITQYGAWVDDDDKWNPYLQFFKNYGSHMLVQLAYGARFQIWQNSRSSDKDIAQLLKAKSCLEVEGESGDRSGKISGCSGISRELRERSKAISSRSDTVIRGGTAEARRNLVNRKTVDNMESFISTADDSDQPIIWKYRPIWELLQNSSRKSCLSNGVNSEGCKDYQRAINLQAAFEGRAAWGCEYRKSAGIILGGMKLGSKNNEGVGYWACTQAKTGCVNDDSCRYQFGAYAQCYGDKCFDHSHIQGTDKYWTVVRHKESGGTNEGVNASCYIGCTFKTCGKCNTQWSGGLPERAVWNQGFSGGIANMASARLASSTGTETEGKVQAYSNDEPTGYPSGYQVDVRITANSKASARKFKVTIPDYGTIVEESGYPSSDDNIGYKIVSKPMGIICPGAGCSHLFRGGERVELVWLNSDPNVKFVKWDGDECEDSRKKAKLREALDLAEGLSEIPSGVYQSSICSFIVHENTQIDLEINTR